MRELSRYVLMPFTSTGCWQGVLIGTPTNFRNMRHELLSGGKRLQFGLVLVRMKPSVYLGLTTLRVNMSNIRNSYMVLSLFSLCKKVPHVHICELVCRVAVARLQMTQCVCTEENISSCNLIISEAFSGKPINYWFIQKCFDLNRLKVLLILNLHI